MQRGIDRTSRRPGAVFAAASSHRFRFLMLLTLAAFALAVALTGVAQAAEISATNMKVSVWPEYDDPRVLVIMQADLEPSVSLPTTVSFNVPKGAEVAMACEVNAAGSHACKPYRLEDKGDYQTLTYDVTAERKVFFEFYYEAFPAGAGDRAFDFVFRPSFAAANLQMEVQEPARSSAFTLDPAFSQTSKDSEGLTYRLQDYQDIVVGEDIPVKISYTKADGDTSVKPQDGGAAGQAAAGGSGGGNNSVFVVLAAMGFATLMFGGYKILKPTPVSSSRRGKNVARAVPANAAKTSSRRQSRRESAGKFCTGCGTSLRIEDRFCPECGEQQA